jgi:hypothetical protein
LFHADGVAPSGLVPWGGQPHPAGLTLPLAWYASTP